MGCPCRTLTLQCEGLIRIADVSPNSSEPEAADSRSLLGSAEITMQLLNPKQGPYGLVKKPEKEQCPSQSHQPAPSATPMIWVAVPPQQMWDPNHEGQGPDSHCWKGEPGMSGASSLSKISKEGNRSLESWPSMLHSQADYKSCLSSLVRKGMVEHVACNSWMPLCCFVTKKLVACTYGYLLALHHLTTLLAELACFRTCFRHQLTQECSHSINTTRKGTMG